MTYRNQIKTGIKLVLLLMLQNLLLNNFAIANPSIMIKDAWVRAVPPMVKTTAAYAIFVNHSDNDIKIVSISSPQFMMVEAHQTTITNGLAQMHSVDQLIIPAQQQLIFKPEAMHLMMMMSKVVLKKGNKIQINFTFSDATQIKLIAMIK